MQFCALLDLSGHWNGGSVPVSSTLVRLKIELYSTFGQNGCLNFNHIPILTDSSDLSRHNNSVVIYDLNRFLFGILVFLLKVQLVQLLYFVRFRLITRSNTEDPLLVY